MNGAEEQRRPFGEVVLVGAGPGDPSLITVAGLEAVKAADCIVHDRLVSPDLLKAAKRGCEIIDAGKAAGRHSMEQGEINVVLADAASRHALVVRLKGGDPFVFGRGGEEVAYLRERGVGVRVIPGVTSATAAAASAGIPVTHRGVADRFTVVNGHGGSAKRGETFVFLMGLSRLAEIAAEKIADGLPPSTPAAVVSNATDAEQRCVTGTLADIAAKVAAAGLASPATIIVGNVVRLRPRRVLVAKVGAEPSRLAALLREKGDEADELQLGEIKTLVAKPDVSDATRVVVTSRRVAGFEADGRPGSEILAELRRTVRPTDSIVHLKAKNAKDRFAELASLCRYRAVDVYENVAVEPESWPDLSGYDAVYFTCASSAERFFAHYGAAPVTAFAIGEETASAIRRNGVEPLVSPRPDLASLASAW